MFSKINKILYAMDLSPKSIKVLGYAIDLSLRYNAYLIVIHIMEQPKKSLSDALDRNIPQNKLVEIHNKMATDSRRDFENICASENDKLIDVSVKMKCVFINEGITHEKIIAQSEKENVDMIIMAQNNQYNASTTRFIGSTTLGVLTGSNIPMLII